MTTLHDANTLGESQKLTQVGSPESSNTLQLDWTWRKWKTLITDKSDPDQKPLYIVKCHAIRSPHLVFHNSIENTEFGNGTLHLISINADCNVHNQAIKIKALKRWKTSYTHLSYAYSNTKDPVPMTWTSTSDFKTWDFICLDGQQEPVAKFSANIWALKKIGNIEFLGPKASDSRAREEIVVTGMTLFYCMVLRSSSLFSFFGAIFASPGPLEQPKSVEDGSSNTLGGKDDMKTGSTVH